MPNSITDIIANAIRACNPHQALSLMSTFKPEADALDKQIEGKSLLYLACEQGAAFEGVIKALLTAGASVNLANTVDGRYPLHAALDSSYPNMALLLADNGAVDYGSTEACSPSLYARRKAAEFPAKLPPDFVPLSRAAFYAKSQEFSRRSGVAAEFEKRLRGPLGSKEVRLPYGEVSKIMLLFECDPRWVCLNKLQGIHNKVEQFNALADYIASFRPKADSACDMDSVGTIEAYLGEASDSASSDRSDWEDLYEEFDVNATTDRLAEHAKKHREQQAKMRSLPEMVIPIAAESGSGSAKSSEPDLVQIARVDDVFAASAAGTPRYQPSIFASPTKPDDAHNTAGSSTERTPRSGALQVAGKSMISPS